MTVIDPPIRRAPEQPPAVVGVAAPPRHRWTADEYMELGRMTTIPHRTELINGEIYDVVSQNNPHVAAISKINRLLIAAFDDTYWVTVQSTARLDSGNVPDPDFAVRPVPASRDDSYHPKPLLIIEVADTTLLFDQIVKGSMYASNQIQDYWIVDVNAGHVEVYRRPIPDASRSHGWRYADVFAARPPNSISPLAKPEVQFEVARMLP